MNWLFPGAVLLLSAGMSSAACPDGSLMQNAARGWIAGQRLPDPQVRTVDDGRCAYTTFRSVLEAELGAPVGVKIGFTSKAAQKRFGLKSPVAGALFAPMLLPDGARLSLTGSRSPFYETDLVVTVRDASIMQARTREDVVAALEDVRPFIELPDLAMHKGVMPSGPLMTAYGATPWRGVLGRGITISDLSDPVADLGALSVDLRVDGKQVDQGRGDMLMGHPLDAVLWLIRHGGYDLHAGSVISLGALGQAHPAVSGHRIRADYHVGDREMHVDLTLVP